MSTFEKQTLQQKEEEKQNINLGIFSVFLCYWISLYQQEVQFCKAEQDRITSTETNSVCLLLFEADQS